MKRIYLLIIILLTRSGATHCQNAVATKNYSYADSTKRSIYEIAGNKILEEVWDTIRMNMLSSQSFFENHFNGISIDKYPNGQICSVRNFVYDIEVGEWFEFYENGKLRDYQKFEFKKEFIFFKTRYSIKTPIPRVFENDTIAYDTAVEWAYYNRPLIHRMYFENGQLKAERFYKENKRAGIWKYFNEEGDLIRREEYELDMLKKATTY